MGIVYGVIVALVLTGLFFLYLHLDKKKYIGNIIKELEKYGDVNYVKEKAYDLIYKINEKEVYIKFVYLGNDKDFSLNSPAHFEVKGSRKPYLINTGGFENINKDKALLVFPPPKKIVKYINENEVVFVKYDEKAFDFYLFTSDELDKLKEVF